MGQMKSKVEQAAADEAAATKMAQPLVPKTIMDVPTISQAMLNLPKK